MQAARDMDESPGGVADDVVEPLADAEQPHASPLRRAGSLHRPSSFSSMYLHRAFSGAATAAAAGDVETDVNFAEKLVLRVVCMTLPNVAYVGDSGDGNSGLKRMPAVVPFRYDSMALPC